MLSDIAKFLKERDNYLVLTHHNADVDAVASALVLKGLLEMLGKKARAGAAESVSEVARKFLTEDVEIDPAICGETVVVVDTSAPEQLQPIKLGEVAVVIDHHIQGNIKASVSHVNPEANSCSELIYALAKELGLEITPSMATLLLGGLIYDTAHFRRATRETFVLVAELLGKADRSYEEILGMLATETDTSEKIAVLKSMKRLNSWRVGDILVSFTSVGSFEAAVARSILRMGADIAVVGAPKKKGLRISGRMNWKLKDKLNLAEIFKRTEELIGGTAGGHDVAASANGKKPEKMNEAFKLILKSIEEKLGDKTKEL